MDGAETAQCEMMALAEARRECSSRENACSLRRAAALQMLMLGAGFAAGRRWGARG